jgi:hypothetical protein
MQASKSRNAPPEQQDKADVARGWEESFLKIWNGVDWNGCDDVWYGHYTQPSLQLPRWLRNFIPST